MSQENVEVVRQAIRLKARTRRQLDELLGLRFPRLRAAITRAVFRLRPASRVRRRVVRRAVGLSVEALNRDDYESGFSHFHPDVELVTPTDAVVVTSFPAHSQGRAERIRLERIWHGDWAELQYQAEELIDLRNQVLLLGRMVWSGQSSGASFDVEWADLLTLSRGQVVTEQVFFNRTEALKAVGLAE
jgi:ketosteroid isomerase-like protein